VNFKCATARWNERERFDSFAKIENFRRQTDGLRRVVSNHAVFNRNFGFHLALLSAGNGTNRGQGGQADRLRNRTWRIAPQPAGLGAKRKLNP
jgi:hypothetical protein